MRSAPTATPRRRCAAPRPRARSIAEVRRSCGQLREVVGVFVRRELLDTVHTAELDLELRDVLDHAIRAHEDLDMLHDRMCALADTRLAMVAYRQNEITKKLSAWAAVLLVPTDHHRLVRPELPPHDRPRLAAAASSTRWSVIAGSRWPRSTLVMRRAPLAVSYTACCSSSVTPSGRPALTHAQ